ncbi:MAG: hypothetical protein IH946_02395, partial [Bacteroidetes bacterium]|nr:hypothetical protein [Bacteroidota bacterium]
AANPLIWFVDSDCVAEPDALKLLLPIMDDPKVGGVSGSYSNMKISFGCTSDNELSTTNGFVSVTEVFSTASYSPSTTAKWDSFDMTTGYMWDSTSNLVVDFCQTSGSGSSDGFSGVDPGYSGRMYQLSGSCGSSSPTAVTSSYLLAMKFWQGCQNVYRYSWTPATGLSDDSVISPKALPSTTTTYALIVVDTTNTACVSSDFVTINVGPDFTLTMTAVPDTICVGNSSTLTASPSVAGTYTYSWTPTSSLNSSTIQSPAAQPTSNTCYNVTVLSSGGCEKIDSVCVYLKASAPSVSASIKAGLNDSICVLTGDTTQFELTLTGGSVVTCQTDADTCTAGTLSDTIGSGVTGSVLYGSSNNHSIRSQWYIHKDSVKNAGLTHGDKISGLRLNVVSNGGGAIEQMTIKMQCVDTFQFATTTFVSSGFSTVKSSFTWSPSGTGWTQITFDLAYVWDSSQHLL